MKKNEIRIGGVYICKVTNNLVRVRIDAVNRLGGWDATNLQTNKKVRVKSAQRLRSEAEPMAERPATRGRSHQAAELPASGPAAEVAPEAKTAKKNATKAKSGGEAATKHVSALDAAAELLKDATEPMQCQAIIDELASREIWKSPGGKTPAATLYSAILREITTKGEASRFRKTERGHFAYAEPAALPY